jgi:hypothetical protein
MSFNFPASWSRAKSLLADDRCDAARSNLIELKREQPELEVNEHGADCPKIRKDFEKLLLEVAADGKCMLHLCHAAHRGTIPALRKKYNAALAQALRRAQQTAAHLGLRNPTQDPCWFDLMILVIHQRGPAGGNRPILYRQAVQPFGAGLTRVEAGESLFREEDFTVVPFPG